MVEGVALTEVCIDAGAFLLPWCSDLGRRRHKKIHLSARLPVLLNSENDVERMTDGDRRELSEQRRMLGLIPVRCKLIWRSDNNGLFVHRDGLRRLEPCFKRLFRQFVPSPIQDSRPDFSCREHAFSEACGKTGQAGRRRYRRHAEKANHPPRRVALPPGPKNPRTRGPSTSMGYAD